MTLDEKNRMVIGDELEKMAEVVEAWSKRPFYWIVDAS